MLSLLGLRRETGKMETLYHIAPRRKRVLHLIFALSPFPRYFETEGIKSGVRAYMKWELT